MVDPETAAFVSAIGSVLAALAALVSALIASAAVYYQRQAMRPNVRVEINTKIPVYDLPMGGRRLGETVLTIDAMNRGAVPVELVAAGLKLRDGRTAIPEMTDFAGGSGLPASLAPGKAISLRMDIREIARVHVHEGGIEEAFVTSATGDRFIAKLTGKWLTSWATAREADSE